MLKSVIHEKLSELYFNYNLLWADELHYDILGKHILEPIIKNPWQAKFTIKNFSVNNVLVEFNGEQLELIF